MAHREQPEPRPVRVPRVLAVEAVVFGGAGFLLAVLWFDLMFDVQVRSHSGVVLPDEVLASISSYYRRVTTDAAPMNRFVAIGMIVTLAGIGAQAATWAGAGPRAQRCWRSLRSSWPEPGSCPLPCDSEDELTNPSSSRGWHARSIVTTSSASRRSPCSS